MNFDKFAKLDINDSIVYPPHNDGNHINVHHDIDWLTQHGFEEHTDEWFAEHAPTPEPPQQTIFTKLQIRRAMRSLEIEEKLDTLLEASDKFKKDWADAQEINLSDPVLIQALAAGDVTAEDIENIRQAIIAQ